MLSSALQELKGLRLSNFLFLSVAGIVNAIGVTVFIAPVNLYDSGISGTSMLLAQITPEQLTLSLFLLLLNIPLFLFGWRRQGTVFTVYAVYSVIMYSLGAWIITDVLPIDVSTASPLAGTDLLLCALFGGVISGVGSGLAIRFGGAMDGIEVLAVIFAKRIGLTVGTFVMIYNVILYIICGVLLSSWETALYSVITYGAGVKTIDFIVEGIDRSKSAMIITNHAEAVCQALSDTFSCGITTMPGKGFYSKADKTVVYIVINRFQISRMRDVVYANDPHAYISISDIAEVFRANEQQ